jgi:hypothetical protein
MAFGIFCRARPSPRNPASRFSGLVIDNGLIPGIGTMEDLVPNTAIQPPGCNVGLPTHEAHSPPAPELPSCFVFASALVVTSHQKGQDFGSKSRMQRCLPRVLHDQDYRQRLQARRGSGITKFSCLAAGSTTPFSCQDAKTWFCMAKLSALYYPFHLFPATKPPSVSAAALGIVTYRPQMTTQGRHGSYAATRSCIPPVEGAWQLGARMLERQGYERHST